ncbi:hypothetical protein BDV59DRAFT_59093 [Aspergillus ambiguus]|uniref:methyltransferase family protein n=1 Tax=Aspergillus ambiguus TaxID=176160 RepID=UPI003CCD040A
MPSTFSVTLALSVATAGVLSGICMYPPNGPPQTGFRTDRIRWMADTPPKLFAHIGVVVFLYHALVTLYYQSTASTNAPTLSAICPYPDHLDASAVTWSPRTMISLLSIFVGSIIRIAAYGGLGSDFTFQLAAPNRLVTSGLYRFVQHPSYTGLVMVMAGGVGICYRWHTAAIACWMSDAIFYHWRGAAELAALGGGIVGVSMLTIRVRDEERMLKERFGEEWEQWHRRTARFVPGIM